MRKIVLGIILGVLVGLGGYIYMTKPCIAGMCFQINCVNSTLCGTGCFCGKDLGAATGKCFSASRADELTSRGYVILH